PRSCSGGGSAATPSGRAEGPGRRGEGGDRGAAYACYGTIRAEHERRPGQPQGRRGRRGVRGPTGCPPPTSFQAERRASWAAPFLRLAGASVAVSLPLIIFSFFP